MRETLGECGRAKVLYDLFSAAHVDHPRKGAVE